MFDAVAIEFPFVDRLPKREKNRVQRAWDVVERMRVAQSEHGLLLPFMLVAKLAGVSTQRVSQLTQSGSLRVVEIDGHPFITENSLVEWVKTERKAGRPPKVVSTPEDCWKVARELTTEKKI